MEQGLQVADSGGDDSDVARTDVRSDRQAAAGRARVLQGERGRAVAAHRRALRADQRARGLVRGVVRPRARRHAPLPPGPDQARDRQPTGSSSPAPRWIPPPRSTAGCAPARSRRRAARACGSLPSAPAGRARRGASWPELRRRLGRRRAELRRRGLARARGPQGSRRRRRARASRTRARPRARPSRACARPTPRRPRRRSGTTMRAVSRREQIKMSAGEADAFLATGAHGHVRDARAARLAALMPLWYVLREAPARRGGPARVGMDVRGVAEDAKPAPRRARHAAGRGGRDVRPAARRDARVRRLVHEDIAGVAELGRATLSRYAAPPGEQPAGELPPRWPR